jgi:hypothetical protein
MDLVVELDVEVRRMLVVNGLDLSDYESAYG